MSPEVYVVAILNPPAGSTAGERIALGYRKMGVGDAITVKNDYTQADTAYVTYEALAFMPGTFPSDKFYTRIPGVVGGYIFNNEMPQDVDLPYQAEQDAFDNLYWQKEAQYRAASSLQEGSELLLWGYQNLSPVGASSSGARAPKAVKIVAAHGVDGVVVVLDVMDKDEAVTAQGNTETPMFFHTGQTVAFADGIPAD